MSNFKRNGYGQVEPNQLSAQKTGQIYASLPLSKDVAVLQNGEFMYYDVKAGTVNADANIGEPMLVFNEVKLYEPNWRTSYKDFAMIRVGDNYVTSNAAAAGFNDEIEGAGVNSSYRMDGFAPRMLKTNIGDIMTTNMVATNVEYAAGDMLTPVKVSASNTLVLTKTEASEGMLWQVAKVYTMPDGQPGLKLQRVQ
jgi:hypothetical protein